MSIIIIPLIIFSVLLFMLDLYIYQALRGFPTKKNKKLFIWCKYAWWGYSIFILIGVFASIFFNLRLTVRAILLVAFFITFVSKSFLVLFLLIDDIRRFGVVVKRKLAPEKKQEIAIEAQSDKISRSEFIVK